MLIKPTMLRLSLPIIGITLLLSTFSAKADTTLSYSDSIKGDVSQTTNIYIKDQKVRTQNQDSDIYTLFDADQNTLYRVNKKDKTYHQTNLTQIQKQAEQAEQQQQQMKERFVTEISKLPEAQRQQMQKQLALFEQKMAQPAPKVSTLKTGKVLTIKQLECDVYIVNIDGRASRKSCINTEVMEKADLESLQGMFKFINSIAQYQAQSQGQKAPDLSSLPSHTTGLALLIESADTNIKSELTNITKDPIDQDDLFVIPHDFKKR